MIAAGDAMLSRAGVAGVGVGIQVGVGVGVGVSVRLALVLVLVFLRIDAKTELELRGAKQNVLGLEIGVDNLASAMEVVHSAADLERDAAHDLDRDAVVLVLLDQREQVRAEHLKNHTDVLAMGPRVLKIVSQLHDIRRRRLGPVGRGRRGRGGRATSVH